ncbi:MAG: WHG domain-containing protein [Dehalococcoidia bacterium]|nr:WHG domain-containing protein [Dehalococcoidia bacterium]MDD5493863.1 WHG domain-containing protein [Dehalococcoidia bacterium]
MPPEITFTKEKLLEAAFKIMRRRGRDKLTARSLARELKCSTMPIYSYLKSMKNLDQDMARRAVALMLKYQTTPRTGRTFYDMGLGYIQFAKKERHLFRYLFVPDKAGSPRRVPATAMRDFAFSNLVPRMKADPQLKGLNEEQMQGIVTKMWIFTHGIAVLVNNRSFDLDNDAFIEELLAETGFCVIEGEKNKPMVNRRQS